MSCRTSAFLLPCLAWFATACGSEARVEQVAAASGVADDERGVPDAESWVSLLNGSDLEGWTPKIAGHAPGADPNVTFRVEEGLLRVGYDGYSALDGQFGHLFYEVPRSRYRLRLDYRFHGEQVAGGPEWAYRNSGVMIHAQHPASMTIAQEFPVAIEVQLLGSDADETRPERPTGNVCTPGTNVVVDGRLVTDHCLSLSSVAVRGDQWVRAEVEVLGSESVRHFVNGVEVARYEQPQYDPVDELAQQLIDEDRGLLLERGWIALQAESHPVDFRNVELLALDEDPADGTRSP